MSVLSGSPGPQGHRFDGSLSLASIHGAVCGFSASCLHEWHVTDLYTGFLVVLHQPLFLGSGSFSSISGYIANKASLVGLGALTPHGLRRGT